MEKRETEEAELVVAVSMTRSRKSIYILRWALENFLPEGNVRFRLLYVYPKITVIPTPIGTWLPVAQVRKDVITSYRHELQRKKKKILIPYQQALEAQKTKSDIVVLESDDIASALCSEVTKQSITHLVVGLSSPKIFSRKNLSIIKMMRNRNISAATSENAPSFCSVYVIVDGKLQNMHPSKSEPTVISLDSATESSDTVTDTSSSSSSLTIGHLLKSKPSSPKWSESNSSAMNFSNDSTSSQSSSFRDSESWVSDRSSRGNSLVRTPPPGSFTSTQLGGYFVGGPPTRSYSSTEVNKRAVATQQSAASLKTAYSYGQNEMHELEKFRMQLRDTEKMLQLARNNTIDKNVLFSINQFHTLSKERREAAIKLKKEKDRKTKGENAQGNKTHSEEEAYAAEKAEDDVKKLKQLIASPITQCQKFSWNEILEATSSLSEEFKIGAGAFGTVFKCNMHYTTAAVKVLHSKNTVRSKQFLQEKALTSYCCEKLARNLEHYSSPTHTTPPRGNPEESCLIYEYMENGSLEDMLFQKENYPPLPWYERVRICWEVAAGALAFLHSTKPRPIVHRDLKPANILLDQHLLSKIGDAGLGTTITMDSSDKSLKNLYKETTLVGTLCYIDPEYQRTGRVSTKSDVYALGIVILQLLTTKPAAGITYLIENALEEGTLMKILDQEVGKWPEEVACELASLGLMCSELRGRDRPDLMDIVLPKLERLKETANNARKQATNAPSALPSHFICRISKDIMDDPYIAADGYTYNRAALEKWLEENNTSPITNRPLPHNVITPNNNMVEAIKEWKSKQPPKC